METHWQRLSAVKVHSWLFDLLSHRLVNPFTNFHWFLLWPSKKHHQPRRWNSCDTELVKHAVSKPKLEDHNTTNTTDALHGYWTRPGIAAEHSFLKDSVITDVMMGCSVFGSCWRPAIRSATRRFITSLWIRGKYCCRKEASITEVLSCCCRISDESCGLKRHKCFILYRSRVSLML